MLAQGWRRWPGWKLGLAVFTVLPVATYLLGNWVIWNIFGDGRMIAIGSTGEQLLHVWNPTGPGPGLVVAILAAGLLFAYRVRPVVSIALSALAGLSTYAWALAVLIVVLAMNPGALS
jgi:hypothetical protein